MAATCGDSACLRDGDVFPNLLSSDLMSSELVPSELAWRGPDATEIRSSSSGCPLARLNPPPLELMKRRPFVWRHSVRFSTPQ